MAATAEAIAAAAVPARRSGFLVGPVYDTVYFIGSPLIALAIGIALASSSIAYSPIQIFSHEGSIATMFIGAFTSAHLFLVVFRSHGNSNIFWAHPLRFTLVPLGLFLTLLVSPWAVVFVAVLGTFWDVYHSSLQTFGLGRIYDRKAGNDATVGRGLDMALNLLLYAGPIVAGVSLMEHVNDFRSFKKVGPAFFTRIPDRVDSIHGYLAVAVLVTGIPFIAYYILRYAMFAKEGYKVSPQKVAILASTAACSIYTWSFDSFGQAFFIMNFFHALQYFALVWHSEKKNLCKVFHLGPTRTGMMLTLAVFLAVGGAYGFTAEMFADRGGWLLSAFIVVSIMHFWWDGFIWSVRKRQI